MTTSPAQPTKYQQLAMIKRVTGMQLTVKPYEEIVGIKIEAHAIAMSVKCADLRETRTGFQIKRTGVRMHALTRDPSTDSWRYNQITVWDDTPDADFVRTYGQPITPQVHRERLSWAMDCHRPGSDSFPLDSADRTYIDPQLSSARMRKHWGV